MFYESCEWALLIYLEVMACPAKLAQLVGCWNCDQRVTGLNPTHAKLS